MIAFYVWLVFLNELPVTVLITQDSLFTILVRRIKLLNRHLWTSVYLDFFNLFELVIVNLELLKSVLAGLVAISRDIDELNIVLISIEQ